MISTSRSAEPTTGMLFSRMTRSLLSYPSISRAKDMTMLASSRLGTPPSSCLASDLNTTSPSSPSSLSSGRTRSSRTNSTFCRLQHSFPP